MARDGSDWDYINEYLGGHDDDGLPNFMNKAGFSESGEVDIHNDVSHFSTFQEAKNWALESGGAFTRCPSGTGFVPKTHIPANFDSNLSSDDANRLLNINLLNIKDTWARWVALKNALKVTSRHLSHVFLISRKSSGSNPLDPNIFDPNDFNNDIRKLTGSQRNKLAEFFREYIRIERQQLSETKEYIESRNRSSSSSYVENKFVCFNILERSISIIHEFN